MLFSNTLHSFAYGEHLDGISQRSLGYRLLAPAEPQPWSAEVEDLARRLQLAPYPDHWPPTDLFCSVLLADGQRLIAVARYGLADHTPSHRRGGLELIGVVGPGSMDSTTALAVYRWLRKRRGQVEDLHSLGGRFSLTDLLTEAEPLSAPVAADPVPVLPIRLWQEGVLLFGATAPSDPDHRLNLLEQGKEKTWQWLPLTVADFPWQTYAQRGPVVAWTPHLAGVALKLDRKPTDESTQRARRRMISVPALVAATLLFLLAGNLWAMVSILSALKERPAPERADVSPTTAISPPSKPPPQPASDESRERFAEALYALLMEEGGRREWGQTEPRLLAAYERAAKQHKELALRDGNTKGKVAVGAIGVLSQRSADHVEEAIRKALANKGFDPRLIQLAAEMVHQELVQEPGK